MCLLRLIIILALCIDTENNILFAFYITKKKMDFILFYTFIAFVKLYIILYNDIKL